MLAKLLVQRRRQREVPQKQFARRRMRSAPSMNRNVARGPGSTPTRRGDSTKVGDPFAAVLRDHLGLILTFSASLLVAIRLLTIANLNPVTALAILQTVGVGDVLVGTLLSLVSPVIVLLLILAARLVGDHVGKVRYWMTFVIVVVLGLFLVDEQIFLTSLVVSVASFVAPWRRQRDRTRPSKWRARARRVMIPLRIIVAAIYVGFFVASLFAVQPWLATEDVVLSDGTHETAFVLEASSDGAVLLLQKNRAVVYEPELLDRKVCQSSVTIFLNPPIIDRILTLPDPYEECRVPSLKD